MSQIRCTVKRFKGNILTNYSLNVSSSLPPYTDTYVRGQLAKSSPNKVNMTVTDVNN